MLDVPDTIIRDDDYYTERLSKIEDLRQRQGGIHYFSEPQTIDKTLKKDVTPERLVAVREQFETMKAEILEILDSG